MRRILILVAVAAVAAGGWWIWNQNPDLFSNIEQYVDNGDLLTMEARYTADQIMDKHRKELLVDNQRSFQEPVLKFHPYLLIDAKYAQADKKTRQSNILWGMVDGEMVIDTDTWETTHGFEDAINADADRTDFRIMQALAKHDGSLTRAELQKELHLEADTLAPWIDNVCDKRLVVETGSELQLHFENPKILVSPQTKLKQSFVSKPTNGAPRISRKYSRSQIEKCAQAAFGPTFTIRNIKDVFLPVYYISVLNPDGSILTTYWNAVTGKQISGNEESQQF